MARQDDAPPVEEGLPPWMATFADMVTLLLCFFVLLLSFANQDLQKFKELLGSVRNAFGVSIERPVDDYVAVSPSNLERKDYTLSSEGKILLGVVMRLRQLISESKNTSSMGVKADKDGVLLLAKSGIMFKPGTADLTSKGKADLKVVVAVLKEYNLNLVVRGHTDDKEQGGGAFNGPWELSSARAASALEYIHEKGGIPAVRLKAVGYADTRPLVKNDSDENRERNRRVEFFFHRPEKDAW